MAKFTIPLLLTYTGSIEIEADTFEDALDRAENGIVGQSIESMFIGMDDNDKPFILERDVKEIVFQSSEIDSEGLEHDDDEEDFESEDYLGEEIVNRRGAIDGY